MVTNKKEIFFFEKILFNIIIQPFGYKRPAKNPFSDPCAREQIYKILYYPMVFDPLFFLSAPFRRSRLASAFRHLCLSGSDKKS